MTKRSELQQRIAETKARLMSNVANRVFSSKHTGIDGLAKRLILGKPKPMKSDPELEHELEHELNHEVRPEKVEKG